MTTALAPTRLSAAQYKRLLADLRRLIATGQQRAEQAVGRELMLTYHRVGQRLVAQHLAENATYGTAVIARLAADLGLDHSVLNRAMAFARAYPDGPPASGLRWAHYRELIAVADPQQRRWYEQQAATQGWSRNKLVEAIRERRARDGAAPTKTRRPKGLQRPGQATYLYAARVERVVDGDTLVALIDLGFQVHKSQRLRLAAIDTPPLVEPLGQRARDFVQQALADAPLIMVKTEKIDLYGRYVAHLFYQPDETDRLTVFLRGRYLNQELVDQGLARALV